MRTLTLNFPSLRWPFWLLALAWFCANTPQAAFFEAIEWMAQAKRFNHQERLASDVRRLLAEQSVTARLAESPVVKTETRAPVPSKPVESQGSGTVIKKIQLAGVSVRVECHAPVDSVAVRVNGEVRVHAIVPRNVPYPPPRVAAIS